LGHRYFLPVLSLNNLLLLLFIGAFSSIGRDWIGAATSIYLCLKGLSHEIDFDNVDENGQM
jgi:hypothetical protein